MKLYTYFRSSTSFRLRIALNLKNVPYESQYVNVVAGEHRQADYLRVNPQGLMPALATDTGALLSQSLALIEYLDEIYPRPALLPSLPIDRWYVRAFAQIIACEIHPLNNLRVLKYLKSQYQLSEKQASEDWYPHWISAGFKDMEDFLQHHRRYGQFCLGDTVSLADVCLVPQVFNAQRYRCDTSPYPTVMRIFESCMKLPEVQKAQPSAQGDAVV